MKYAKKCPCCLSAMQSMKLDGRVEGISGLSFHSYPFCSFSFFFAAHPG